MTHSDDSFSRLIADDGSVNLGHIDVGWLSSEARDWFWIATVLGTVVLTAAWFWYGMAFSEEMSEQCKSVVTGSSEAGTGFVMGGIPLTIAYGLIALTLVLIGVNYRARRGSGVLFAFAVVLVATLIGIGVSELLWGGRLFAMSAGSATCTSYIAAPR